MLLNYTSFINNMFYIVSIRINKLFTPLMIFIDFNYQKALEKYINISLDESLV